MSSNDAEKSQSYLDEAPQEQTLPHVDKKLEKSVVRRLDCVVLPIVGMLYLLSIIDRSNVGNARVAGMAKDLNLSDWQYKTGAFLGPSSSAEN